MRRARISGYSLLIADDFPCAHDPPVVPLPDGPPMAEPSLPLPASAIPAGGEVL